MAEEEQGNAALNDDWEPGDEDPASPARIADLHAGQTWVCDDFDAPLPDSFWLGDE
jgi:hypothetical protein